MAGNYEYDVFFSYKRHNLTLEWTRQVHSHLQLWLSQQLNRPARMFIDDQTIEVGDRWPDRLRQGLRLSRCMVGVWQFFTRFIHYSRKGR